jgi:hypothetical protein
VVKPRAAGSATQGTRTTLQTFGSPQIRINEEAYPLTHLLQFPRRRV